MHIIPLTVMDVDMYVVCLKLKDEYRYSPTNHVKKLRRSNKQYPNTHISHINRGTNKHEITHRAIG